MILSFWKYLEGYVIIKIRGFAPERFINLCANKNIYLWNIKKVSEGYMFSMSVKAFFLLAPIARKTRCRVKIVKKIGVPFKFHLFRKRKFFLVGLLFSLGMILFLSFFVWRIEIEGNLEYTSEEIIDFLDEHQIAVGTFKNKVDCSMIDDILLSNFDHTMWVSSELKGTQLIIHIREGVDSGYEKVVEKPCDIIAEKDGTIISIVMRKGTPLIKQDDVVKKGDILVTGTLEIKELQQLKAVEFTYSDADILMRTSYNYEDFIDYQYIEKEYQKDKEKKDHAFRILKFSINLIKPNVVGNYDKIVKYHQTQLFRNFYLPFYFTTSTYMPYYELEKTYTQEEAIEILKQNFQRYVKKLQENNIQILANDVIFKQDAQRLMLTGNIIVAERVGEKVYFDENLRRQEYNEYFTDEDGDTP